ncbi:protein SCAR2-like isoform X2 [Impatiens glandulifera]|nr:protein SCAR2-like isoform X2 [Impatiens glandulifera]
MATAARGHGLLVRVQQLEAEFPSIETTLLSQTSHSSLLNNSGTEWHPNLRMEQNLITQGDFPRFVMDSYEECRGPPRLFILDKFDVAGAGACLKRYTDPSYFKVDGLENPESHREKKRKAKKKGSHLQNGDNTPQALQKVHTTRLHDLLHKETVENSINGPAFRVKLKRRLNENKLEQSYMEKFLKINSSELDVVPKISVSSAPLLPCNGSPREELSPKRSSYSSSSDIDDSLAKPPIDQLTEEAKYELSGVKRQFSSETYETFSPLHIDDDEKEIEVDRERKMESDYQSDDIASDVDNYMDALATIDSDNEADMQCRSKNNIHSSKQQPDIDASEADLPDSQPIESFILTDNESISSSGELSELSYTDNSNLTKAVLSDDSVSAEDDHLLSEQPLIDNNNTTHHLENVCNDVYVVEADTSTYSCGIGDEQSSSCHTDTHPVSLSLDLQGSLKEDASENTESNEEGHTNNENREYPSDDLLHASKISDIPSDAVQTLLSVSSAENHLDYQDQDDTSLVLRKLLESENNEDVDFTENATEGEPHTSDTETVVFKAPDFVETIAEEPVLYPFDHHIDPSDLTVFHVDEQPESFVALGEKQPEFSVLLEEEEHHGWVVSHSEEPQMTVLLEEEDHEWAVSRSEEPQMTVSHEQDQFSVLHADEQSHLILLHTEEHNQLVVSHKEEHTSLVVSDIEMQLAEESTSSREEDYPQLLPSLAAEKPQSTLAYKEEQLQLITSHTEERPLSMASCAELQSQSLALTDPCSVVLREHDAIVIPEVVFSCKYSPSIHCLTNDSMEQTFSESPKVISPVELQLPSMDNLKGHVSEADYGENDFFVDRTASVPHEFHSDTLNSKEVSKEYVPLSVEGTETKQSKATMEVSAINDIYLSEDSDLPVVEESNSITGPLHPHIEIEHSLGPIEKALLLEEMGQQTGAGTCLETGLCNADTNMEYNPGMPLDIHEIMKRSELTTSEISVLDSDTLSACNSQIEAPIEHRVLQIVEQFEKELKSAEKVSPKAYLREKQSTTTDFLYLEEQPSGSPKFAEVPMSEFSKPTHVGYVDSPMSTFPVKTIESPNLLDQEDHSIVSGPNAPLPPSNAHEEVMVPPIAIFPRFDLPGPSRNMFDEMPPLPPLPPVQWRIPKILQHAPEGPERNLGQFDVNPLTMSQSELDHEIREGESTRMQFSTFSAIKEEVSNHECNLSPVSTVVSNEKPEDFHIPNGAQSSMVPSITDDDRLRLPHKEEDSSSTNGSKTLQEKSIDPLDGLAPDTSPENEKSMSLNVIMEEVKKVDPPDTALASTDMDDGKPQSVSSNSEDHSMFAPQPEPAYVKSNGGFQKKIPRPRNPLIDAVVALDKTKLRKVTERVRPPSGKKVDERDTFLEQIRTKSFNLKPTAVTRPSVQGPKTNLNVAAILEKANSIRQSLAGSDDDDDDWSDS